MSMRVHTIVTRLRPEDAYTLIEFLDQVRDMLMQTYGDEMTAMLQEASQREPIDKGANNEAF
jgi:hypothetical protein